MATASAADSKASSSVVIPAATDRNGVDQRINRFQSTTGLVMLTAYADVSPVHSGSRHTLRIGETVYVRWPTVNTGSSYVQLKLTSDYQPKTDVYECVDGAGAKYSIRPWEFFKPTLTDCTSESVIDYETSDDDESSNKKTDDPANVRYFSVRTSRTANETFTAFLTSSMKYQKTLRVTKDEALEDSRLDRIHVLKRVFASVRYDDLRTDCDNLLQYVQLNPETGGCTTKDSMVDRLPANIVGELVDELYEKGLVYREFEWNVLAVRLPSQQLHSVATIPSQLLISDTDRLRKEVQKRLKHQADECDRQLRESAIAVAATKAILAAGVVYDSEDDTKSDQKESKPPACQPPLSADQMADILD